MKAQYYMYEIAVSLFLLSISFLIFFPTFYQIKEEKEELKMWIFDFLSFLDYKNKTLFAKDFKEILYRIQFFPIEFFPLTYKEKITFACFCTENQTLFLNNMYNGSFKLNDRSINISFFPLKEFEKIDYANDGLIIWGCDRLSDDVIDILKRYYLKRRNVLIICNSSIGATDINQLKKLNLNFEIIAPSTNTNIYFEKPKKGGEINFEITNLFFFSNPRPPCFTNFSDAYSNLESFYILFGISSKIKKDKNTFLKPDDNHLYATYNLTAEKTRVIFMYDLFENKNYENVLTDFSSETCKKKKLLLSVLFAMSFKDVEFYPYAQKLFFPTFYYKDFFEPFLLVANYQES